MTPSAVARRRLAAAGAIIALGGVAACVVLMVAITRGSGSDAFSTGAIGLLNLIVSYAVVGWLIASRRTDNPIGWVFLAIGRRFDRSRHDAERPVAAFGAHLRDEVDLGALRHDLLATIDHTLQPTRTGVWLRDAAGPKLP
jgi:hypothetical protein